MLLTALAALQSVPVIDVHRHAGWAYDDKEQAKAADVARIDAIGLETAVTSVTDYDEPERWSHTRFIVGVRPFCPRNLSEPRYICFPSTDGWADLEWLETEIKAGRVHALHELNPNTYGISPDNPRIRPYWALAARYDIPVGVHTQRGPRPGARNSTRSSDSCCPDYDPAMGNPALLRPVLDRHPGLRVWVQHVGAGRGEYQPYWDETLSLLGDYPNVYVDLSITNGAMPLEQYEATLARLIKAGFGDRIMFGSDMLPVDAIIERLYAIDWLTKEQRGAILRENAARFFRLDD
ncbi:amidohydrolase family protein [Sphingomicrobium marinum]|uniref:amidohydrolase family protein n=1 Tax=Sphingomicrobium marinum TaxID=1227950 RepID=UPI00223F5BEE|nr:amidohydrolase family protein [Sphingomicrobium marinum]